MSPASVSVVVPTLGGDRLGRVLDSLAAQTLEHHTVVVDDGGRPGEIDALCRGREGVEVVRMERNSGYVRAVNRGAERAEGETLVLINDDCVCDPEFVERITAALDPAAGIVMAAGVMRDWSDPSLIDSAGMELDRTLLVWDYLNGQPVEVLERGVADPIGPSGAAAAFDRRTFLDAGGFDEALFAYWEDVDLVLRLRREGARCRLATDALGTHEHSATFGSGSRRKNYLIGYGRGYVLRKWGVLTPRRWLPVLVRDGGLCLGQALIDRNLGGLRGRLDGWRAATPTEPYPAGLALGDVPPALEALRRRFARRSRLRARSAADRGAAGSAPVPLRSIAFFHLAETSGPSRSLERELEWLADLGELTVVVPGDGSVAARFGAFARVEIAGYEPLARPGGPGGALRAAGTLVRNVRRFRLLLRESRAELAVIVTTVIPAALIAARLERVPAVVYCGEIFDQPGMGAAQRLAWRGLRRLTGSLAAGIVAGSRTVAAQFAGGPCGVVEAVYPPVEPAEFATGDGAAFRAGAEIPADTPLVASVGAITEGRGQDLLVRALAIARLACPKLRCVIAGSPFPRSQDERFAGELARLVDHLGVRDAVMLAGQVNDVPSLLAAADVLVNPARFEEPFGRVPFEAAIAGTPAVLTRVGAIPELFTDGESALVVEPGSAEQLAAAILRVLGDAELAGRLVAGAREFAAARLTPTASLEGFHRVVETALATELPRPAALRD